MLAPKKEKGNKSKKSYTRKKTKNRELNYKIDSSCLSNELLTKRKEEEEKEEKEGKKSRN